jgi:hypothetical protein
VPIRAVIRSTQVYEPDAPVVGGGAQIHYSADNLSSYSEVGSDGLVVNYPASAVASRCDQEALLAWASPQITA